MTPQNWKIIGIVFTVLAILQIVVLVWLRQRIKLAIGILKTAALFVEDNLSALFLPIGTFVAILLFLLYWLAVSLLMYTIGTVSTAP